jgi:hypothetical protein
VGTRAYLKAARRRCCRGARRATGRERCALPLPDGQGYLKHVLVAAYRQLVPPEWMPDARLLARIRMKPVRTLSGVTVVTVLTKATLPGKCIFCPTDVRRMPAASDEPEPCAACSTLSILLTRYALAWKRCGRSATRPIRSSAHPGRHLECLSPRLPGVVRAALLRCP